MVYHKIFELFVKLQELFQLECCAVHTEGWLLYQESKWFDLQPWNPGGYT